MGHHISNCIEACCYSASIDGCGSVTFKVAVKPFSAYQ